ncbi:MAG: TPM domain-containing protein [Sulfuricaulis sp.]
MNLTRLFRHLLMPHWRVRRVFPARTLRAIQSAIQVCESTHAGEIRFAVEGALHPLALLSGQSARARAVQVFSQLRVWDTEHNNGVLIYLLLADRVVEIIADRGVHVRVGSAGWENICRKMEVSLRLGKYEVAVLDGIHEVGKHLARHYPGKVQNELAGGPVVL